MSLRPIKRLMIVGSVLLFSVGVARAQTPSPEAMAAARELVTTLKLSDQYKALLPAVADAYTPYYNAMVDSIATVYANTFSVEELRQIEAFYRQPVGQKFLEKSQAILQQSAQIGEDTGRKAAEALRTSLTQLLRQKGHKL